MLIPCPVGDGRQLSSLVAFPDKRTMEVTLKPIAPAEKLPSERKASILLVDDNPANLLSLRALLDGLGQNLVEARSGEEAIERVKAVEFAVILLDVLMPGINGFETAKAIRGQERSQHTPVIFLTASDIDRPQMEEGYALGAVDFLLKPLMPMAIQAKVRGFVQLFQDKQRTKHEADQLRMLVEGAKDYAIFRLDPQGNVASWNAGAEHIKQYRADEIIGQHFSRFYPQDAIDRGWPSHELTVAKAEGRFEDEGWRVRKDGTQFWANVVITTLYDEAGKFRGFSKITRDLTERKRSEENARRLVEETTARRVAEQNAQLIQEQRERLHVTLASIGDAVISTDSEGRVDFLNPVAQELIGWKNDEAARRTLTDVFRIINENTRQPVQNPALRALKEGVVVGLTSHTVLIAKDGKERPIDDSAAPIRDADGNVVGSVLVFRDVSEQRAAAQASRRNQELLQLIHKIGRIGHWEWNSLTDENNWSPEIEALYGLPPGGFEGGYQGWAKLLHPDDLPKAEEDVRRAMETGEYFSEFRVIWPDGSVHWLETRAHVFKDNHDKPVRIMGVNMDVTERKRIEQAIYEASRRKDEFLATLAHELRNPLAPLVSGLQVIKLATNDSQAIEQSIAMMDRQLTQLVRLVDDLMDVSRISRGKIELRKEQVELVAVVNSAVETSRPLIDEMGHELTVTLPQSPVVVDADLIRLAQVFLNLLNNAAKYTERGGHIWLTAERQGSDVVVSVKDTGIGIAADQLPRLFTMFSQLDHSLERSQGGLGIGLTLVKRLVEMHSGRIEARSDGPGKGSEFVVRLPVVVEASMPQGHEEKEGDDVRTSLRILVVDDNRDAADSLAMMLTMMGNDTRKAYDGEEAVTAAVEYLPDVILLDIGLPKLTGYEACRRIRQQPGGKKSVIIAQTGWGQEEDRQRTHEAGFDHHMVKPVAAQALMKLLADWSHAAGK